MSEKRFYRASVCGDDGLYDKEDGCIIVNVRSNIDLDDNWNTVVDKLNEQQAIIKSKDKQLERLYNYFQDYLKDEMSGNAFSEMWDFVKEDEKWEDE